jgi:hypothetical protein
VSGHHEVTYALDFGGRRSGPGRYKSLSHDREPRGGGAGHSVPRIARLLALAIRFEELLRNKRLRDYAELARLGRVTRARMTQIMKLLDLAPDIQEQILFLPPIRRLNERNLRPVAKRIDWDEQRCLFHQVARRSPGLAQSGNDIASDPAHLR